MESKFCLVFLCSFALCSIFSQVIQPQYQKCKKLTFFGLTYEDFNHINITADHQRAELRIFTGEKYVINCSGFIVNWLLYSAQAGKFYLDLFRLEKDSYHLRSRRLVEQQSAGKRSIWTFPRPVEVQMGDFMGIHTAVGWMAGLATKDGVPDETLQIIRSTMQEAAIASVNDRVSSSQPSMTTAQPLGVRVLTNVKNIGNCQQCHATFKEVDRRQTFKAVHLETYYAESVFDCGRFCITHDLCTNFSYYHGIGRMCKLYSPLAEDDADITLVQLTPGTKFYVTMD